MEERAPDHLELQPAGGAAVAAEPAPAPRPTVATGARPTEPDRARLRYWVVVASHFVVDLYPMFIISLVASLQHRLALSETQAAVIISINGVVSGLSQPIFGWLGDRLNTRLFGAAGLAVGALAISGIGWAQTYWQLLALQILGMAGVGVFHPVITAVAGRLAPGALTGRLGGRSARGMGLAIFFAAGVGAGGFVGPIVATRINAVGPDGVRWLLAMAVPGLVAAGALWALTRRVPHRAGAAESRADGALAAVASERDRWLAVGLLFVSNTLRFTVNLGLFYLFKRLAEERLGAAGTAAGVASLHGDALAASQIGMGVSALLIGRRLAQGHERGAMIATGLLAAPVILLMPALSGWALLAAAFAAAFGFFGVIPTSISLAQRLLPHATGVTGAILMGGGWAISAAGPILAERVAGAWGLPAAFAVLAGLMASAGGAAALISRRLVRAASTLA
ncbi:MAG: MFS transporter [Planctomycetota bacterium]|nr:MAG: MFS transporter [Planctomycetota bacterium]